MLKPFFSAFLASALIQASCLGETRYTVTLLPTLGGAVNDGYSINATGQIAGVASVPSNSPRAFRYSQGVIQNLGTLSGFVDSYARGINADGDVVGYATTSPPAQVRAFVFADGAIKDLGVLPGGTDSYAYGLNDQGDVVGQASTATTWHAFVAFSGGALTDLGATLSASESSAVAINNSGQIVGWLKNPSGKFRAFLHANAQSTDFSPSPTANCLGSGINDHGQAVGYVYSGGSGAFLYSGGATTWIEGLAEAYDINNAGQIVGSSWVGSGPTKHAFISQNGKTEDLNALIPGNSGWILYEARSINDAGQIVGRGRFSAGYGTFLLTPVPPALPSRVGLDTPLPRHSTRASMLVRGHAEGIVTRVLYRVGSKGDYQVAKGTNSWRFRARLLVGRNRIFVVIKRPGGKSERETFLVIRHKR